MADTELKRTQLWQLHVDAGATMVDFGGWDMPVQYPAGIVAEHLYTRKECSLFDVSHMGRLLVSGPDRLEFLQHVLTSNAAALELFQAQYCIIPDECGGAIDDAYLYRFEEERFLFVVNASNTDKDLAYLSEIIKNYDCTITNISADYASIAVQGPKSCEMLTLLNAGNAPTLEPKRNSLSIADLEGHKAYIARTGYTGEPLGYEVYLKNDDAIWLWNRLLELGARPAGLGARDTLRLEGGLPLYGHEMGVDPGGTPMPIYAVPLSRFAVNFSELKGDFVGREPLARQQDAYKRLADADPQALEVLPRSIRSIVLTDRGVIRAGMPVYQGDEQVGWITSGTMVPYYVTEGEGPDTVFTGAEGKRSIGLAYINSNIVAGAQVEVDVRGRRLHAAIVKSHLSNTKPPYARPIIYQG